MFSEESGGGGTDRRVGLHPPGDMEPPGRK